MKKKISLLLGLAMIFTIFLTACGGNETGGEPGNDTGQLTVEDIVDKGKLIVGTNADYPPFQFHAIVDGKDEIVGFDIDLGKYIAEELGVEIELNDMEFNNLLGALDTGMVDIVIAAMNPSPERDANFTDVYYEVNLGVLVHKDNPSGITSIEDLAGKSIGVQIGTVQEEIAKTDFEGAEVVSLGINSDVMMNLKTKKIDCAIMESPVARAYAAVNDDIAYVEGIAIDSGTDGVAIAVKTGNDELTEKLNEIIADVIEQGLIEKWVKESEELSSQVL